MSIGTRLAIAAMIGATGAGEILIPVLLQWDRGDSSPAIAAAGGGALTAGLFFADCFGRRVALGWCIALLGAVLATAAGGALGGAGFALADPHLDAASGLALGAVFGLLFSFSSPAQAVFWAAAFTAIHLAARHMRGARPHAIASEAGQGFTP